MIWILVFVWSLKGCSSLDISYFHDSCGLTIEHSAGELKFDAKKLSPYLPRGTCSVTIAPHSDIFNTDTQVMFYFTKFEISIFCDDTNVTVVDGAPNSGYIVQGLPRTLCGHNRTLEDPNQIFTTRGERFTVTFRRSDYGWRYSGNFSIKYILYHTEACDGDDVFQCDNGRCIPNEFKCSSEINSCGNNDVTCSSEEEANGFVDILLGALRESAWIIIVLVLIFVGRLIYSKYPDKIRSILRRVIPNESRPERRSSVQMDESAQENQDVQQETEPSARESVISDTSSLMLSPDAPPSYDAVSARDVDMTSPDTQQTNLTPSCPPPSYEDVMSKNY